MGSGLPVERALAALNEEADDDKQRHLLAAIRADINSGSTLGRALAQFPQEFPAIDRAVIAAGEQSGHLSDVLNQLANDLEDQQVLRAKLLSASLYPAIVSLVALAIVIFLVTSVCLKWPGCLRAPNAQLPGLTVAMLAISDFVRTWGWFMVLLLAGGVLAFRMAMRQAALRLRFDAAWLRLPLIGRPGAGLQQRPLRLHTGHAHGCGCAHPQSPASGPADTLSNQALRADALEALVRVRGRRTAGHGAGAKRPLSRSAVHVCAAGANKLANCRSCCSGPPPNCRARCSAAPWPWPRCWSPCSSWPWAAW